MRDRCAKCRHPDQPLVFGKGQPGGIVVVGEAPGAQEVVKKSPFVGKSGDLLKGVLRSEGVEVSDCYFTNACICHPPGNETPSAAMVKSCRDGLIQELIEVAPTKILTVGSTSLNALVSHDKKLAITNQRGRGMMVEIGGREVYCLPTYHPAAILRDDGLFRDFRKDIRKFVDRSEPEILPDISLTVPTNIDEAIVAIGNMKKRCKEYISCDIETTGFNQFFDRILSVGFSNDTGDVVIIVIPTLDEPEFKGFIDNVLSTTPNLVFHNIKFDLQFLEIWLGHKIKFAAPPLDTMLINYCLDERPMGAYAAHGLKTLSRIWYDLPDYKIDFEEFLQQYRDGTADWDTLLDYQAVDCYATARLAGDLVYETGFEDDADEKSLMSLATDILIPGAIAFSQIENHGALIDTFYLQNLRIDLMNQQTKQRTNLMLLAEDLADLDDYNPQSPIQTQKILFDKLKLPGERSANRENLLFLSKKTSGGVKEFIDTLLEYRVTAKILQTFVVGLMAKADLNNRVHSDFFLHGTATGRLSSRDPNLQNIPARMGKTIRDAFVAPIGYKLIAADYSQLELRIAAWLSQDPGLMKAFVEGRDIHKSVASQMYKKPESEITKAERHMAKYVNFGILYGRGANGLTEGPEVEYMRELGIPTMSVREAQKFLEEYMSNFPKLADWIEGQHRKVVEYGYVVSPLGRRRRFPLMSREIRPQAERQAVNSPIQGTASDVCFTALTRIHNQLPPGANVLFSVHDSIMVECREDLVPTVVSIMKYEMEVNLPIKCNVPLKIDLKIGNRWGEMEEE